MTTEELLATTQKAAIEVAELAVRHEDEVGIALVSTAEGLTITTAEEMTASGELLKGIKARQKVLSDLRLSITRPMDAAKKRVMELFQPAMGRLATAEQTVKIAVLTYTQEQGRLQREAQARLDAAAEQERLRLLEAAEEHRGQAQGGQAEALEQEAAAVQAPTVAPAETPHGAVRVRTNWHAEVTDLAALAKAVAEDESALPPYLIQPNMVVLNAMAQDLKGDLSIPGVKAVSKESVAARS